MDPQNIMYEISRHYVQDHNVDSGLKDCVDGFRRSRDLARLSTCSSLFEPHRHGLEDWRFLRQIESFFKKNAVFADRSRLFEGAKLSFHESEALCKTTNDRLRDAMFDQTVEIQNGFTNALSKARRYIHNVLGSFEVFTKSLPDLVRVTSGATVTRSRKHSLPQYKMTLRPYISSKAVSTLTQVYNHFGFVHLRPHLCDENRVELVPKDWRKDRTIACEPEGNLALQLAFDTWAKRRLRRYGLDLSRQDLSQSRAKAASVDRKFVTVDFSNASDTISYNTVARLFPLDWFNFLDSVRSPHYRGVFGRGTYEKFSSMGNGSTFCIETLVFASVCYAVGSRNFLVYGDDVIIEDCFFDSFLALSTYLGFVCNPLKTFRDSPIRESCGGEYFNGTDVTPVVVKGIDNRKVSLCHVINSLGILTSQFEGLGKFLSALQREFKLPLVPYNASTLSGVWIDPRRARKRGILVHRRLTSQGPCLNYFKAYSPVTEKKAFVDSRGYYLWFLNRTDQVRWAQPWEGGSSDECTSTSSAAIFQHTYVRKWVVWNEPHEGIPVHVYLNAHGLVIPANSPKN